MKKIIFDHFPALVVQMHVHINMYIQISPPEPEVGKISFSPQAGGTNRLQQTS
ncbi:MAG: hypothetical protein WA213_10970 [Terriglobales bacterium]